MARLLSIAILVSLVLCCWGYRVERYQPAGPSIMIDDGHTHYGINIGAHLPVDENDVIHTFPNDFFFYVPETPDQEWTSLTINWGSYEVDREICASISVDAPPSLPNVPGSYCGPENCGNHSVTVQYPVRGQWNVAVYACDEGPLPFEISLTAKMCTGGYIGNGCTAKVSQITAGTADHGELSLSDPKTVFAINIAESTNVDYYSNITIESNSAATPLCMFINYTTCDDKAQTSARTVSVPLSNPVTSDDSSAIPTEAKQNTIYHTCATRALLWYGACADPWASVPTRLHYNLKVVTNRPAGATCNPFASTCTETLPVQNVDVSTGAAVVTGTTTNQLTWYGETTKYNAAAFTFNVPQNARYVIVSSDTVDPTSTVRLQHCAQYNHISRCDMYPTTLHNFPSGGQWSVMVLSDQPAQFTLSIRVWMCSSDCSNNGVCNVTSNTCICDDGYVGYACDQPEIVFMDGQVTIATPPHSWHYYEFDVAANTPHPISIYAKASVYKEVFPFIQYGVAPDPQQATATVSEASGYLQLENPKPGRYFIGLYNRYMLQQVFTVGVYSGALKPPKDYSESSSDVNLDAVVVGGISLTWLIVICVVGTFMFTFALFMTIVLINRYNKKSKARKSDAKHVPLLNTEDGH